MYQIKITAQAKKELKSIKRLYQHAIAEALSDIAADAHLGKPLKRELSGKYSYRVGQFRIIYVINNQDKSVTVLTAGYRSDIYK